MPRPLSTAARALLFAFVVVAPSFAQAPSAPSVSASIAASQEGSLVRLSGTVHPLARAENDRGAVPDSLPANRMLVLLNPPAERQQALQQFLHDAHAKGSPAYHQWLTPEQFGARFGARDEDVQQVRRWLQSHGFAITRLTKSGRFLEFSGTAAQVREGLHAPIHQYEIEGKTYYSVASEVSVPQGIAPLLKGFAPLNNFPLRSAMHTAGRATYAPAKGSATPQFTTSINGQTFYAISPEDFATQYDIAPVYQAGTDGTGQTIGIIGQANIDLTVAAAYRKLFGLTGGYTQVVIDGEDPGSDPTSGIFVGSAGFLGTIVGVGGILDSTTEDGYLGVELSGAIAPKATVNYYIAGGTQLQDTLALAAMRAIEDNQAAVLSVTREQCEQLLGPSGNQLWASLWEQAAAQGQTVVVSSGSGGPASCGDGAISVNGQTTFLGKGVNGLASTPWNVAVGATDFYYADYATGGASAANDWNASNNGNLGSLKAPLPEQPWDSQLGLNIPLSFLLVPGGGGLDSFSTLPGEATGGGPSSCSQESVVTGQTGFPYVCVGGYAKPAWQNAPGVPDDGARDLPDLSLMASNGRNLSAYAICVEVNDCATVTTGEPQVTLAAGTSSAAPAFAGIMALVNQKFGRQGQANFVLYALANQQPNVFHDITL
ncbi:MAG: S53 family peptidase, partial [Candidatus Acidiferrum sp.]